MYYWLAVIFFCYLFASMRSIAVFTRQIELNTKLVRSLPPERQAAAIGRLLFLYRLFATASLTGIVAISQLHGEGLVSLPISLGALLGLSGFLFYSWRLAESMADLRMSNSATPLRTTTLE